MHPMLDDLELPQVQEISTADQRMLAEYKPPGMAGSLLQNLGRAPTCLVLHGVAVGPEGLTFVETLDSKFKAGVALPFIADIIADAAIETMAISDLHFQELAGKPQRYAYTLTLREYIEPTAAESAPVDESITDDAEQIQQTTTEQIVAEQGILDVIVEASEANADLSRVQIQIEGETTDGEAYSTVIDQQTNGVFRKTDVPAGRYDVRLSRV